MAENRRDTIRDVWGKILVAARAYAVSSGASPTGPLFFSTNVPNRRDTIYTIEQKVLAALNSIP